MDIQEIKRRHREAGFFFFEPDTMRFFRSKVAPKVYEGPGGVYFVTSEKGPRNDAPRRFTVRQFFPEDGSVGTAGPFNEMDAPDARYFARECARIGVEAAEEARS